MLSLLSVTWLFTLSLLTNSEFTGPQTFCWPNQVSRGSLSHQDRLSTQVPNMRGGLFTQRTRVVVWFHSSRFLTPPLLMSPSLKVTGLLAKGQRSGCSSCSSTLQLMGLCCSGGLSPDRPRPTQTDKLLISALFSLEWQIHRRCSTFQRASGHPTSLKEAFGFCCDVTDQWAVKTLSFQRICWRRASLSLCLWL